MNTYQENSYISPYITEDNLYRVKNDPYGNGRLVFHYRWLLPTGGSYELAVDRAKALGGKKYKGKDYRGGIVFVESPSILINEVNALIKKIIEFKPATN